MENTMVLSFQIAQGAWPVPSILKKAKNNRGYNCSKRKYGRLRMSILVTARSNCKPQFKLPRSEAHSR